MPYRGFVVIFAFLLSLPGTLNSQSDNDALSLFSEYKKATNDPIAVQVQDDLHAQVNKWTQNLNWLKTYPIVSVGVAYSFHTGKR